MHPLERSARVSDQHFLLDTHDLHRAFCLRKGSRQRRSPSRYRLDPGRFSVPIPPLLSVGVLHAVLPSCPVLHPQVVVAHVGRRQDPGPDDGLGYCPVWRSGEETEKKLLVDYLISSLRQHDWYAARYFLCEAMAFANVVGQMFLMNRFFDGEFLSYGIEVIRYSERDQETRTDPMIRIFPRVTKCRFYKYGSSGNVEMHDALCVLPLNVINEKIFIFLWFWFIILSVLTGLVLVFRVVIAACPLVRVYLLNMRFRIFTWTIYTP
ncbi:innexin shaking-B [Trichonephila clavata]|uniref:Innexin n=1 Tax=Trichonephila clavata TaxID=2740835 RepID=A0A8X6GF86_TRICU|nr:innexin shaking-B [Trichonephila clavata]